MDYGTRTHHTNQDVYERIQPDDMKYNAAVVASFVWHDGAAGGQAPAEGVHGRQSRP